VQESDFFRRVKVGEEDIPTNSLKPGCDWILPSSFSEIGYAIGGTTLIPGVVSSLRVNIFKGRLDNYVRTNLLVLFFSFVSGKNR